MKIKSLIYLFSFFSLFFQSCHETKRVLKSDLNLKMGATDGILYYRNKPFTGIRVTKKMGKVFKLEEIKNGKRNGLVKQFFLNQSLSYLASYVNGRLNGESKTWWRNGSLKSVSNYKRGLPHGKSTSWYSTGEKFKSMNFYNGKEQGLQKAWRKNGKLYSNYEVINGRIFGLKKSKLCYQLKGEEIVDGSK